MTEPEHTDLGAYVLGLLEPDEAESFEEHLLGCDRCTAELDEFSDLPALLDPLVAEDDTDPVAAAQPSTELLPKVLDEISTERSQRRRRTMFALAAAVVLLIAGPAVGVVIGRHSVTTPKPVWL